MENKIKLLIIACSILIGCKGASRVPATTMTYEIDNYTIVVIDSCEYIMTSIGGYSTGTLLVHKGNCKNPYHKRQN
jgi:hypothetical protein